MSHTHTQKPSQPIDVVITWVDGNDPILAEKRNRFLQSESKTNSHSGALPTRFASNNEIRYCVLSILKFAPFVRNIFIVTDNQAPGLHADIKAHFPDRVNAVTIVDHKDIFRGYEEFLPTFNSTSIETMIWRINGLSENFVCFNDDFFLIRPIDPEDWVINDRPVLRGNWRLAPYRKIFTDYVKGVVKRHFLNKRDFQPKLSFYLRQWNAASLLGMKVRYFFHCHVPYVLSRSKLESFFNNNETLLRQNISHRFRSKDQFIMISLANHLEILSGNKNFAKLNLGYLHPSYYSKSRLAKKMRNCENNTNIKSVCIQSLDMVSKEERARMFGWVDSFLKL